MLLDWDQSELASRSGVGISTIKRLESRSGKIRGAADTVWRIKEALEKAGIIFIESDEAGGPGVRLTGPRRGRAPLGSPDQTQLTRCNPQRRHTFPYRREGCQS
jgi:transcriptional regulator with XRE-family HTH domain